MATQAATGIPDLPPDELEQWSNDLVEYLTSEHVPSNFREWARAQAARIDAYMASADDLDSAPDDEPVEPPPARRAPPPKASRQPRARPAAADAEPRTMVFEMPASTAKLILGVLAGLLVLGVVYGIVALTRDNGSSIPTTAANQGGAPTSIPFDDARAAELMKLVATDPTNKDALRELGDMNLQSDRYTDAITWYTKLSEADPTNVEVLDNISTANLYLNNTDEAKVWIDKALAIDPNDVSAHYNMGYVYASGTPQDLVSAVKEWDLVVQLSPDSPEGQTAKTHSDGLRAQMTRTAAAGSGSGATIPPASKENTPVPETTPTP
jgi:tetratricopeptide (TPR) repeat protein